MAQLQPVLVNGQWRPAKDAGSFSPLNPATRQPTGETFPVSSRAEVDEVVQAAARASEALLGTAAEARARFLELFASRIEARRAEIVAMAHTESGLPIKPRLDEVELPRTTGQLRQAAAAARQGSWTLPTIDTKANIRSFLAPLEGGVVVFGPNNFPMAFNSVAGGDFAAAIAAGNPVIGKANSSHPGTTRLLAEEALAALKEAGLPEATVQLIYRTDHQVGQRLVSHPLVGATGYTGSRHAGLVLKEAADRAGKPIYLELSSINPVLILPGALRERGAEIAGEFTTSCLLGAGQFCTNPGVVLLLKGTETETFISLIAEKFKAAAVGTLLGEGVERSLGQSVAALQKAGAELLVGGAAGGGTGCSFQNTLLRVSGTRFLAAPEELQQEAFGNASLLVVADGAEQAAAICRAFEGNLTGALYTDRAGSDEALYRQLAPILRRKVGRLLDDKMPTGVAVSPAMNHGGPYPATGHPGFTAVGIPASLRRFAMLQSFDNVRPDRLPPELRDQNPTGQLWRCIDGAWTQGDVPAKS
jgi:alpha-ketoglutaric semialdehyde dehydrogenase